MMEVLIIIMLENGDHLIIIEHLNGYKLIKQLIISLELLKHVLDHFTNN